MIELSRRTFRNAEAGPVRNKSAVCNYCSAAPNSGQHFSVCKQCHRVAYCSVACQKAAWDLHKVTCEGRIRALEGWAKDASPNTASQQVALGLPPVEHRIELLVDFIELYTYIAHWAFTAALFNQGVEDPTVGPTGIPEYHAFYITLQFRKDCDGNPSKAYFVKDAQVVRFPENDWPTFFGSAGVNVFYVNEEKQKNRCILEFPNIIWESEDTRKPTMLSVPGTPAPVSECLPSLLARGWLDCLQRTVANGLVFREEPSRGRQMRLGRLEKSGSHWRWRSLKALTTRARMADSQKLLM